jgi:hypothetical protein
MLWFCQVEEIKALTRAATLDPQRQRQHLLAIAIGDEVGSYGRRKMLPTIPDRRRHVHCIPLLLHNSAASDLDSSKQYRYLAIPGYSKYVNVNVCSLDWMNSITCWSASAWTRTEAEKHSEKDG